MGFVRDVGYDSKIVSTAPIQFREEGFLHSAGCYVVGD
jgi:hypothetical protein